MQRRSNGIFWFVATAAMLGVVVAVAVVAVTGAGSTTRPEPAFNVFLPARFPPELTPTGESELINGVDAQGLLSGSWSTRASVDEVVDAYRDTFRGASWELLDSQSLGDVHTLSFRDRAGDLGYGVVTVSRLATSRRPSTSVGVTLGLPPPVSEAIAVPVVRLPQPVALPRDFPVDLVPFDGGDIALVIVEAARLDYEGLDGFGVVALSDRSVGTTADFYRAHFRREGVTFEEAEDRSAVILLTTGSAETVTIAIAPSVLYPSHTEVTVTVGKIVWP